MKLKLDIAPDIASIMAADAAGERAVTAAAREASSRLKRLARPDHRRRPRLAYHLKLKMAGVSVQQAGVLIH